MFRSKKDVDAHVRDIFSKCKSEKERLQLCFGIAKLYTQTREFDSARRYLETYLNSNPENGAEARKLMGDIQLELQEFEEAFESYKASYAEGQGRDVLNRICDLLTRGYGIKETADSKKKWFDMQKSTVNNNPSLTSARGTGSSSPVVPRRGPIHVGGPPKTGFNSSFANGNTSPLVSSASKTNGNNVDLQLRYLERRFDDGLGKILDQNTLVLEQMLKTKDEMKDLTAKVDQNSLVLEQMLKFQDEMKGLQAKVDQNSIVLEQMSKIKDEMKDLIAKVDQVAVAVNQERSCSCSRTPAGSGSPSDTNKISPATTKAEGATSTPISQLFKKPEGSWTCSACYCSNGKDVKSCVACQTCRPGFENSVKPPIESGTSQPEPAQPSFSFGVPATNTGAPTFSFGFGNTVNSNNTLPSMTNLPVSTTVVDSSSSSDSIKTEEKKDNAFSGLNLAGKFSFADLAKNNTPAPTFSNQSFSGAGAPLFSSLSTGNKSMEDRTPNNNTSANNADEDGDDFVPTAEFQPVIPLPPLVEVKKGDEDENTICEYRAKLYRFVAETKEWKERGVGNIKLLQSKTDPNKCRVVMWRERIGKLACNFSLFPDIKITNYQNNPKVLCWKCQDSAEETSWETFTVRFGNEDSCANFKTEMERLAKLTTAGSGSPSDTNKTSPSPATTQAEGATSTPISQLFKKPEGSWTCSACYCNNGKDVKSCIACQTCRPGFENSVQPPVETATPQPEPAKPSFSFGFPAANTGAPTFSFGFGNTGNSNNAPLTISSLLASTTMVDGSESVKTEEKKDNAFTGLNLAGKFSFADLAKNNTPAPTFSNQSFSGAGAPLFSSLSAGNKSLEDRTANNTSANADDVVDEFVPTAEFQPVIPLPPLVEVKKGDEDENTICEYRAKLYRFVAETKEWKERGVGNIKLLQSKSDPNKCRVVMWRERIGKLACNFSLFPDIKITNYQNNPKVLCWKCQDSAEETSWETFTVRFGNEDSCAHFKTEMERLAKLTTAGSGSPSDTNKVSPATTKPEAVAKTPISQLFKNPEGSWTCSACYCSNGKDVKSCIACQASRPSTEPTDNNATGSCPGCIGCDSDTYRIREVRKQKDESVISAPLASDSSNEPPTAVSLSMFTSKPISSLSTESNRKSDVSVDNNKTIPNISNSFSNFSFSFQTPEKSTPISHQFTTPSFSFKTPDGYSSALGGGSIFTPPVGGNPPGTTPSPFVSPFSQQASLLNNSVSPQSVSFSFSQPIFSPQPPTDTLKTEETSQEPREEDEYEDVDDEEEDECMFEDDAHVFIQDDMDSGEGFTDKGEAVVRVLYDGESYCARLVVIADGETIAEHLVAAETVLDTTGELTYEWTGVCNYEAPVKSRIRAVFSNEDAFKNFASIMSDSLEFAEQAGITEAMLLEDTAGGY